MNRLFGESQWNEYFEGCPTSPSARWSTTGARDGRRAPPCWPPL